MSIIFYTVTARPTRAWRRCRSNGRSARSAYARSRATGRGSPEPARGQGAPAPPRRVAAVDELQADHAAGQACDEPELDPRDIRVTGDHRPGHGEGGADADPHRVGGAGGDVAHRPGEAAHREHERAEEDHRRPKLREALRLAERRGPDGLEHTGHDEDDPCHDCSLPWPVLSRSGY